MVKSESSVNELQIRTARRVTVVAALTAVALLAGGSIATPAARADDVTITGPSAVEPIAGQTERVFVAINWPGVSQGQLHVWWEYAPAADSASWYVIGGRWGAAAEDPGRIRLDGAEVKQWDGWHIRAAAQAYQGGPLHYSKAIAVRVLSVAPDQTLPKDVSLAAGGNALFRASAPTPPYATMSWEKQSPGTTTWEALQTTTGRTLSGDLVVSNVARGDNGTRYRPVFFTELGVPHYGRVAMLSVSTPGFTGSGIFFDVQKNAFRFFRDGVDTNAPTGVVDGFGGRTYYSVDGNAVFGWVTHGGFDGYVDRTTGLRRNAFVSDGQGLRYFDANGQYQRIPASAIPLTSDSYLFNGTQYLIDESGRSLVVRGMRDIGTPAYGGSVRLYALEMPRQWVHVRAVAAKSGLLGLFSPSTAGSGTHSMTVSSSVTAEYAAQLINRTLGHLPQDGDGVTDMRVDGWSATYALRCPRDLSGMCPLPPIDELDETDLPGVHAGGQDINPAADIAREARAVLAELRGMTPQAVDQLMGTQARQYRDWIRNWDGQPLTEAQLIQDLRYRTALAQAVGEQIGRPAMARLTAAVNGVFDIQLQRMVGYFNTDDTAALDDLGVILSAANEYLDDESAIVAENFREEAGHAVDRYLRFENPRVDDYEQATGEAYARYIGGGVASAELTAAAALTEQLHEAENDVIDAWNAEHRTRAAMMQILATTPRFGQGPDGFTFTLDSLRQAARTMQP